MLRYIVLPQKLDKTHPLWPNETLFFIKDLTSGRVSFSCYTRQEIAADICNRKNNK